MNLNYLKISLRTMKKPKRKTKKRKIIKTSLREIMTNLMPRKSMTLASSEKGINRSNWRMKEFPK